MAAMAILDIRKEWFQQFYVPPMPPIRSASIQLTVWEEMSFEEVQDGGHFGYQNRMILVILNLYVNPMPPIKFQLNPTYSLGGDVVWRISKWRPAWTSERNDFNNSESQCPSDGSHWVSAQSDLWYARCCLKNFKMATRQTDGWQTDDGQQAMA